jgi:Helicase associated domain
LVPHGYKPDPSFAEWIHRQRTGCAAMINDDNPNPLMQSRMVKLEEIGFNFTVHTDKWMDQYNMLKAYKEKHGDCQVPTHYTENPKLGRWTHTQRHQRRLKHKLHKNAKISKDRIALLDELGFNWEVRTVVEQPRVSWQQRYDELLDYYQKHGNFLFSSETHPKLYRWCCEQRNRLQSLEVQASTASVVADGSTATESGNCSRYLSPERVKLLSDIGFTSSTILAKQSDTSLAGFKTVEEDDEVQHTTLDEVLAPLHCNHSEVDKAVHDAVTVVVNNQLDNALNDNDTAAV